MLVACVFLLWEVVTMEIRELALPGGRLLVCDLPPGTKHAGQHDATYNLLEAALERKHPPVRILPGGKPVLEGRDDLHFSLAHCTGLAACLVASTPCGVDVELIRPLRQRVLRRAFTTAETSQIQNSPCPDETFFRLWTLKESFVKATGDGIAYGLSRVPVALEADGPRSLDPLWRFWQSRLDNFLLACCMATK